MAPAMAQEEEPAPEAPDVAREIAEFFGLEDASLFAGNNTVFYPWVANDDDFGLGAADTSISVQNVEGVDAQIFIYVGDAEGGFALETTAFLSALPPRPSALTSSALPRAKAHRLRLPPTRRLTTRAPPTSIFPDRCGWRPAG